MLAKVHEDERSPIREAQNGHLSVSGLDQSSGPPSQAQLVLSSLKLEVITTL